MSTNSVTKKIIAASTVYLDNSSTMVATIFFTESELKVKKLYEEILALSDWEKIGLENGV